MTRFDILPQNDESDYVGFLRQHPDIPPELRRRILGSWIIYMDRKYQQQQQQQEQQKECERNGEQEQWKQQEGRREEDHPL